MHKIYSSLKGFSLYDFYFECDDDYFIDEINGDNDGLGFGEGDAFGNCLEPDYYWGSSNYSTEGIILFFTET